VSAQIIDIDHKNVLEDKAMPINKMGLMNAPWGICGFTSSLYALHNHSPQSKHAALEAGGESPTKILAEIKTYLRMLQADGRQDILDSIEQFTQSFAGFNNWTIASYIERINAVVVNGADQRDPKFGIGMPPAAVVDYLKRVCDFPNAKVADLSSNATEMILGMGTTKLNMPLYDGLGHYLYLRNNTIHSWGQTFSDTASAMNGVGGVTGSDWKVVCKIVF
jgi:hypothetical protein|tara:strand:- start:33956 stop:34618 length:663 start_codon:yes stop_codon:yes gene_type:complete